MGEVETRGAHLHLAQRVVEADLVLVAQLDRERLLDEVGEGPREEEPLVPARVEAPGHDLGLALVPAHAHLGVGVGLAVAVGGAQAVGALQVHLGRVRVTIRVRVGARARVRVL